jgi:hypothetical protein
VVTELSNSDAIASLKVIGGDFASDCAIEIAKLDYPGMRFKDILVAWGFKLAEEKANPVKGVTFSPAVLKRYIRARKPLAFERDGNTVVVGFCGPASKHSGSYRVTNGQPFGSPTNAFYGYITPAGEWKPTRAATPEIVEIVGGFLNNLK